VKVRAIILALFLSAAVCAQQQETRTTRSLYAFPGKTPKLDGLIEKGEWDDATQFFGVQDWIPQFSPTTDPSDLALHAYVKHDGKRLYFAFDITDDILYGIDTERWLPKENPKAHDLTREGFPWFGDEMEILLNPSNRWTGNESVAGNGQSWQMVCNLTKSRLGGVGAPGLLEGEPRKELNAWNTYQKWIESRVMECAAKPKADRKGYIIEWAINFNPCIEIEPGRFYSTDQGNKPVGLNIALGDLDEQEKGQGNFGNFHHEDWFSGAKNVRTQLRHFGTLWMMSDLYTPPPQTVKPKPVPKKATTSRRKSKTSPKRSTTRSLRQP
jgi:SSS family solute:Na+ symporter